MGSVKSCCHRCGTRSTLSTNNNNNNNDETNSTLNGSEPVYQGIVERDISVIRKETEITSLKSELAKLKTELSSSQKQVFTLEDSEKMLRERLADEKHRSLTLEKMASIQKQKVNYLSWAEFTCLLNNIPLGRIVPINLYHLSARSLTVLHYK